MSPVIDILIFLRKCTLYRVLFPDAHLPLPLDNAQSLNPLEVVHNLTKAVDP